jgi:hypothetical protein
LASIPSCENYQRIKEPKRSGSQLVAAIQACPPGKIVAVLNVVVIRHRMVGSIDLQATPPAIYGSQVCLRKTATLEIWKVMKKNTCESAIRCNASVIKNEIPLIFGGGFSFWNAPEKRVGSFRVEFGFFLPIKVTFWRKCQDLAMSSYPFDRHHCATT